jgi:NAD(P)H dehydrogenase (quinone)
MLANYPKRKTTLEFCGIRPAGTLMLGPVVHPRPDQRQAWLEKARAMAARMG